MALGHLAKSIAAYGLVEICRLFLALYLRPGWITRTTHASPICPIFCPKRTTLSLWHVIYSAKQRPWVDGLQSSTSTVMTPGSCLPEVDEAIHKLDRNRAVTVKPATVAQIGKAERLQFNDLKDLKRARQGSWLRYNRLVLAKIPVLGQDHRSRTNLLFSYNIIILLYNIKILNLLISKNTYIFMHFSDIFGQLFSKFLQNFCNCVDLFVVTAVDKSQKPLLRLVSQRLWHHFWDYICVVDG